MYACQSIISYPGNTSRFKRAPGWQQRWISCCCVWDWT